MWKLGDRTFGTGLETEAVQFHSWKYIDRHKTLILASHPSFNCSVLPLKWILICMAEMSTNPKYKLGSSSTFSSQRRNAGLPQGAKEALLRVRNRNPNQSWQCKFLKWMVQQCEGLIYLMYSWLNTNIQFIWHSVTVPVDHTSVFKLSGLQGLD
jgi:hypothetical protein